MTTAVSNGALTYGEFISQYGGENEFKVIRNELSDLRRQVKKHQDEYDKEANIIRDCLSYGNIEEIKLSVEKLERIQNECQLCNEAIDKKQTYYNTIKENAQLIYDNVYQEYTDLYSEVQNAFNSKVSVTNNISDIEKLKSLEAEMELLTKVLE